MPRRSDGTGAEIAPRDVQKLVSKRLCDRGMSGQDIIDARNLRAHGINAAGRVARQHAKGQIDLES